LRKKSQSTALEHEAVRLRTSEMSEKLGSIMEEIDELKDQMNERGDQMSETSPLVHIKQRIRGIKREIRTFNLRIGVVSHSLLSAKFQKGKVRTI
jgi:estrogen-related receptor beta like 1